MRILFQPAQLVGPDAFDVSSIQRIAPQLLMVKRQGKSMASASLFFTGNLLVEAAGTENEKVLELFIAYFDARRHSTLGIAPQSSLLAFNSMVVMPSAGLGLSDLARISRLDLSNGALAARTFAMRGLFSWAVTAASLA